MGLLKFEIVQDLNNGSNRKLMIGMNGRFDLKGSDRPIECYTTKMLDDVNIDESQICDILDSTYGTLISIIKKQYD